MLYDPRNLLEIPRFITLVILDYLRECVERGIKQCLPKQSLSSGAMTSLKPFNISSFCATKPSTIAKERKPPAIVIDADEGPDPAVSIEDNAATEKDSRLVDVAFFLKTTVGGFLTLIMALGRRQMRQ